MTQQYQDVTSLAEYSSQLILIHSIEVDAPQIESIDVYEHSMKVNRLVMSCKPINDKCHYITNIVTRGILLALDAVIWVSPITP